MTPQEMIDKSESIVQMRPETWGHDRVIVTMLEANYLVLRAIYEKLDGISKGGLM